MIAQLTSNERQRAILIGLAVALCGLLLGLAGRDDPIGMHGALIFLAGLATIFLIGSDYCAPEALRSATGWRGSWSIRT